MTRLVLQVFYLTLYSTIVRFLEKYQITIKFILIHQVSNNSLETI